MVNTEDNICYIMRGCPGSGKSTLTSKLVKEHRSMGHDVYVFCSDDYFVQNPNGLYRWTGDKLKMAHRWTYYRFCRAVDNNARVVIVDNTNVTVSEMRPYVRYAHAADYHIVFSQPDTPWAFDAERLAQRNSHNVSKRAIERMLDKWVKNPTVKSVLGHPSTMTPDELAASMILECHAFNEGGGI